MLLTEEQWTALRQRKAINDNTKLWSVGPVSTDGSGNKYPRVPYIFQSDEPSFCKSIDTSSCLKNDYEGYNLRNFCRGVCGDGFIALPATSKPIVMNAIKEWEHHTCIEFEDITSLPESSVQRHRPHIQFSGGQPCNSHVGIFNYFGIGQIINLGGCPGHVGNVHEIGHALGFHHEFTRSDRDKYIKYFKDNVANISRHNFKIKNDNNYSIEYDYASIMHYGPYAASNSTDHNKVVLMPLDPVDLQLVGQRDGLSFRDKHLANKMYNCTDKWERKCGSQKPRTCGEGYTGKHCTCVCPPHKTGSQCEMEKPGSNGDYYYEKRNQALNEEITTPMRLTVKVPAKKNVIFVKSVIPPVGKIAKVTFTTSNAYPKDCSSMFLHVVTDDSDLEGKTLCDADLDSGEILTSNETIVINTILRHSWHPAGTTLWEAEITFHDITGCAATAATTTTTTTTTPTSTTTTSVTTSATSTTTTAAATTTTGTPGYKPYPGKFWFPSTCPLVKNIKRVSCEECMMDCTINDDCTAVHCNNIRGYALCQLIQCPVPAPEPSGSSPDWSGTSFALAISATTAAATTTTGTPGYKSYPGWGWTRSACPRLEPYYKVESCEACTIDCTDNDECTAFIYWTYLGTPFCLLLECPLPVPEPNFSQSGMTGYVIE